MTTPTPPRTNPSLVYQATIELTTLTRGDGSEVACLSINDDGLIRLGTFDGDMIITYATTIRFEIEEDPDGRRKTEERRVRRFHVFTDRSVRVSIRSLKNGTVDFEEVPKRTYITTAPR